RALPMSEVTPSDPSGPLVGVDVGVGALDQPLHGLTRLEQVVGEPDRLLLAGCLDRDLTRTAVGRADADQPVGHAPYLRRIDACCGERRRSPPALRRGGVSRRSAPARPVPSKLTAPRGARALSPLRR